MQEIGEFQEFNDDVEYILDALQDNNPISTRCLSAITLASKCMAPAFRMHVRAHGTVAKFFKALHDATRDQVRESTIRRRDALINCTLFSELGFVYGDRNVCAEPRPIEHGSGQGLLGADVKSVGVRR